MTTNAETFVVKLNYDGQLRRFPIAKGTSFADLRAQVVHLLEMRKDAADTIVLKYADEEGDLITISSDLELASAQVPEKILRLTVLEKRAAAASGGVGGYPPVLGHYPPLNPLHPLPDVMDVTPTAPTQHLPQGAEVFRAFADGCGGGAHPHTHPHPPPPGLGGEEDPRFGGRGGFGGMRGRGGWRGGPHRGGHPHHHRGGAGFHHGVGPYGMPPHHPHHAHHPHPHPRRADMSAEELREFKKERKHMHKEMKREWKEANKSLKREWKEGRRCGDGMPWALNSLAAVNDRLIARFAKDVTIPDGTHVVPSTPFVKTWRLRNEGTMEWPQGCVLRFLGKKSDSLGGPETVPVPAPVPPNAEVEVSVNLVAPEKPGRYTGYWKMCAPDGRKFGQRVWVSVVVPGVSSSSSDSDQEADRYEALVDSVLATGLCAKRHRVFRMLQKSKGDVNLVCERLAHKEEKQARKQMKKQMKL